MGNVRAQIYNFDSATLGLALNSDISYVGCVLACRNTNLNKPIDPLGASVSGMHTEMSDFLCAESTAPDIMSRRSQHDSSVIAIDAVIGARQTTKSAVVIDTIINQDACY